MAEALTVLDRLGEPEEIVEAEQPRPPEVSGTDVGISPLPTALMCTSSRPRYCYYFWNDQKEAYRQTEHLFDGARDNSDATKANAFQHSYWTARMVRTMYTVPLRLGIFDDSPDLAIDFATRHESVQRHGTRDDRLRSAMDRHNNTVGYRYSLRYGKHHNNTFLCNGMRGKVKTASGAPRRNQNDRVYWLLSRDKTGHYVHLLNRRC